MKGLIILAEYTNANIVSVAAGQNVPLTETAVNSKPCIVHRQGAGIVTLRGLTNQNRALFRVSYGGTVVYHAVLYQVEDAHRLGAVDTAGDEYLEGMIVRILGMEVYNSVE